jgi:hypothetical protein
MLQYLITLGHILFVIFMLITPFVSNSPAILFIHFQIVIFLLAKWTIKEWECGFTMLEYRLRNIKPQDSVLYKILHPVTDIHNYPYNGGIIILTLVLGMLSYYRSEMLAR